MTIRPLAIVSHMFTLAHFLRLCWRTSGMGVCFGGRVLTKKVPVYNDNNTAIKVSNSDFSQLLTCVFSYYSIKQNKTEGVETRKKSVK
jgi:hypothetical protein